MLIHDLNILDKYESSGFVITALFINTDYFYYSNYCAYVAYAKAPEYSGDMGSNPIISNALNINIYIISYNQKNEFVVFIICKN